MADSTGDHFREVPLYLKVNKDAMLSSWPVIMSLFIFSIPVLVYMYSRDNHVISCTMQQKRHADAIPCIAQLDAC